MMDSEIPRSELHGEFCEQHFSNFDPAHRNADTTASEFQRIESVWNKHDEATNVSAGPSHLHCERHVSSSVLIPPNHSTESNANQWPWIPMKQDAQPPAPEPAIYFPVQESSWIPEPDTSWLLPQSVMAESPTAFSHRRITIQWNNKENESDVLEPDSNPEYMQSIAPGDPQSYCHIVHGRHLSYKKEMPVARERVDSITQSFPAGISGDHTMRPPETAYRPLKPKPSSESKTNLASSQQLNKRDSYLPSQYSQFQQIPEMISKTSQLNSVRGKRSTPPAALQSQLKRSKAVRRDCSGRSQYPSAVAEETQAGIRCPPASLPTSFYLHTASPYQYSPVESSPSSAGLSGGSSRRSASSSYTEGTELTPTNPPTSGFGYAMTSATSTSPSSAE
ncbi:hypothetical protein MMC17_009094 [Xylographa soralifera]|nr:hypothetical protein [Xylographa soralifera]